MKKLVEKMLSDDEEIRTRAMKALVRRRNPACVPLLLHMLMNPVAGDAALSVLARFAGNKQIRDFLLGKLRGKSRQARIEAALILEDLPVLDALPLLKRYASSNENLQLRAVSLRALLSLLRENPQISREAGRVFAKAAKHPAAQIRQAALQGLAATCDPRHDPSLRQACEDPDPVICNVLAPLWKGAMKRRA
ncbi:MAG: hypothetical protein HY922_15030 [Elusimicrobia bacterium]|nr:hypothetical protein [Elusimicrobiota bacterium]